ncbi:MAG: hypothetical protein WBY94_28995 [Polyangiaceae bacterium]
MLEKGARLVPFGARVGSSFTELSFRAIGTRAARGSEAASHALSGLSGRCAAIGASPFYGPFADETVSARNEQSNLAKKARSPGGDPCKMS